MTEEGLHYSWLLIANSVGIPVLSLREGFTVSPSAGDGAGPAKGVPLSTQGLVAGVMGAAAAQGIHLRSISAGSLAKSDAEADHPTIVPSTVVSASPARGHLLLFSAQGHGNTSSTLSILSDTNTQEVDELPDPNQDACVASVLSRSVAYAQHWLGLSTWDNLIRNPNHKPTRKLLAAAAPAFTSLLRHGQRSLLFGALHKEAQLSLDLAGSLRNVAAQAPSPRNSPAKQSIASTAMLTLEPHWSDSAILIATLWLSHIAAHSGASHVALCAGAHVVLATPNWQQIQRTSADALLHFAATLSSSGPAPASSAAASSAAAADAASGVTQESGGTACDVSFDIHLELGNDDQSSEPQTVPQTHFVHCSALVMPIAAATTVKASRPGQPGRSRLDVVVGTQQSAIKLIMIRPCTGFAPSSVDDEDVDTPIEDDGETIDASEVGDRVQVPLSSQRAVSVVQRSLTLSASVNADSRIILQQLVSESAPTSRRAGGEDLLVGVQPPSLPAILLPLLAAAEAAALPLHSPADLAAYWPHTRDAHTADSASVPVLQWVAAYQSLAQATAGQSSPRHQAAAEVSTASLPLIAAQFVAASQQHSGSLTHAASVSVTVPVALEQLSALSLPSLCERSQGLNRLLMAFTRQLASPSDGEGEGDASTLLSVPLGSTEADVSVEMVVSNEQHAGLHSVRMVAHKQRGFTPRASLQPHSPVRARSATQDTAWVHTFHDIVAQHGGVSPQAAFRGASRTSPDRLRKQHEFAGTAFSFAAASLPRSSPGEVTNSPQKSAALSPVWKEVFGVPNTAAAASVTPAGSPTESAVSAAQHLSRPRQQILAVAVQTRAERLRQRSPRASAAAASAAAIASAHPPAAPMPWRDAASALMMLPPSTATLAPDAAAAASPAVETVHVSGSSNAERRIPVVSMRSPVAAVRVTDLHTSWSPVATGVRPQLPPAAVPPPRLPASRTSVLPAAAVPAPRLSWVEVARANQQRVEEAKQQRTQQRERQQKRQ